ncbi:jg7749 [Pararge aegeria aegeria]|uniref:Jg7749 protein n=1 Tax=Pararge aegeria aegeria TaxID=348720 RepID=A0A8S4S1E8_9NEOP|nr:jg7749 [Pararge aegeria aegeria]
MMEKLAAKQSRLVNRSRSVLFQDNARPHTATTDTYQIIGASIVIKMYKYQRTLSTPNRSSAMLQTFRSDTGTSSGDITVQKSSTMALVDAQDMV